MLFVLLTRDVPEPQFSPEPEPEPELEAPAPEPEPEPEPEPRQWSPNSVFFGSLGVFFCIFRFVLRLIVLF